MNRLWVRPASLADIDAILLLEQATPTAPHWPRSSYSGILDPEAAAQRCLFVAEHNGTLAAFAVCLLHPAEDDARIAELESVAVDSSLRRGGIGRALCNAILVWCRSQGATSIDLEVRASSAGPIALYTSLGFIGVGSRPLYYSQPSDDALIMQLDLERPPSHGRQPHQTILSGEAS